jgi:hypothetical protein
MLGIGFIVGVALAMSLAANWARPVTKLSFANNPASQGQLQNENDAEGISIVSNDLKQRAVRKILESDLSKSGGCTETRKITPEPVSFTPPGVLTERWGVHRCGATVFYNVQFIPSPEGEMEVTVSAEN